jgi:hypothetical protein
MRRPAAILTAIVAAVPTAAPVASHGRSRSARTARTSATSRPPSPVLRYLPTVLSQLIGSLRRALHAMDRICG